MKTKLISLTAFLILLFVSCEKEESPQKEIDTSSILFTDCNTGTKSTDNNTPKVRLIGLANGKLTIKMINTEFCCGTDSISVDKTFDENKIIIEIIDNGPFSWCYCPHDLEFDLTSLENKDYVITLIESEHSYSRDTFLIQFLYSEHLDTIISGDIETTSQIRSVNTIVGGCNNQDFTNLKSGTEDYADTVEFEIINTDTLNVFVGMNYICCAPFDSEIEIINDTLIMTINDTCSNPYNSCYCRCECYYTWDFQYIDFEKKEYNFIVKVNDPREENTIIFKQGLIDLTE